MQNIIDCLCDELEELKCSYLGRDSFECLRKAEGTLDEARKAGLPSCLVSLAVISLGRRILHSQLHNLDRGGRLMRQILLLASDVDLAALFRTYCLCSDQERKSPNVGRLA